MGNYKPLVLNSITIAGITVYLEKNKTLKALYDNVANSSTADGFLDSSTGLIYQVPTGKTFHAIGHKYQTTAVASTVAIYSGDTENAETAIKVTTSNLAVADEYEWASIFDILTGKFITYTPASTRHSFIELLGYETTN